MPGLNRLFDNQSLMVLDLLTSLRIALWMRYQPPNKRLPDQLHLENRNADIISLNHVFVPVLSCVKFVLFHFFFFSTKHLEQHTVRNQYFWKGLHNLLKESDPHNTSLNK